MPDLSRPSALITGGAGFIGSQLVRTFREHYKVTVFDTLTYAGFYSHIKSLNDTNPVQFFRGDLRSYNDVQACFQQCGPFDVVIHAAAESSVDRSIKGYEDFVTTNVLGSANLFQVCRENRIGKVVNFGTDEIFGHFGPGEEDKHFTEDSPIAPRNIYSASKAAQHMMARAFHITHGVPILTVCPSNCYGPRQHPEKLIPKIIVSILNGRAVPIYNGGRNIREWLHVEDAARAILLLAKDGRPGEIYNIGGGGSLNVMETYDRVCALLLHNGFPKDQMKLIQAPARPGDDFRYSVDCSKLSALGWRPEIKPDFISTVQWYLSHEGRQFLSVGSARLT